VAEIRVAATGQHSRCVSAVTVQAAGAHAIDATVDGRQPARRHAVAHELSRGTERKQLGGRHHPPLPRRKSHDPAIQQLRRTLMASWGINVSHNPRITRAACPRYTRSRRNRAAITPLRVAERRPEISRGPASERRRVLAEDVAHGTADLAHRAAVAQRVLDGAHEVAGAARGVAELLQSLLDDSNVAVGLERLQAVELGLLGGGVYAISSVSDST